MNVHLARRYRLHLLILVVLLLLLMAVPAQEQMIMGLVIDESTGRPIPGAVIVSDSTPIKADHQGRFVLPASWRRVSARAHGYRRAEMAAPPPGDRLILPLVRVRPKALYLSAFGIGSSVLREQALLLIEQTELNALVIDIKGDRGVVPYRSAALASSGLEQTLVTVADMPSLMKRLRGQGLYLIARIVVFKDDPLARSHPGWAVHDTQHRLWTDAEALAWIDPFQEAAWERTLALAEEAAELGFDEIQFDYVRFPDASSGAEFHDQATPAHRVQAINQFLAAASRRLARFNVFVAADIFGYVTWNTGDTGIGQQLETLAQEVDYVCPMLYPSGFTFGIPGYRDPVLAPFETVDLSLRQAMRRTGLPGIRFRPWLQAFRDYGFDRRPFGGHEIRRQIDAAEEAGSHGWMLWNAQNRYTADGLKREQP